MAVKVDDLLEQALQAGLTQDDINAARSALPDAKRESSEDVLTELVRRGKLTRFQASHILKGKAKALALGSYILQEPLGQGGMGMVFRARHSLMERTAAIKLLPTTLNKNPENVQRFLREVKAAAQLVHPNIVQAYDAGSANGRYFLAMECVEGKTLDKLVKDRGRLPVSIAVDYVMQAAQGLTYAHQRNIIHRDIKPANLILGPKNRVQILDMGLARIMDADPTKNVQMTGVDTSMGTADFMAPEQAVEMKKTDARSDIYSLGCTLYFLVRGEVMYAGAPTTARMLAHQQKEAPSLCEGRADVPLKLDAIYQRMVAKRPDDRYASMSDALTDLQTCLTANAVSTAKPAAVPASAPRPGGIPAVDDSAEQNTRRIHKTRRNAKSKRNKNQLNPVAIGATIAVLVIVPLVLGGVYLWSNSKNNPDSHNEKLVRDIPDGKKPQGPPPGVNVPHNRPPEGKGPPAGVKTPQMPPAQGNGPPPGVKPPQGRPPEGKAPTAPANPMK